MGWFALDLVFTSTLATYGTYRGRRRDRAYFISTMVMVFLLALKILTITYPDDGQQMTAYWTGILLQLPLGWVHVMLLYQTRQVGLLNIEIWSAIPHSTAGRPNNSEGLSGFLLSARHTVSSCGGS